MSIVAALDKVLFFNASSKYSVLRMKTEDSSVPAEARSPYRYHDHLIRFTAVGIELPQTDTVKIEMDPEMTFKEQYLNGLCGLEMLEACTEKWHAMKVDSISLRDYLGLTEQEYDAYLQTDPGVSFRELLDSQRKMQRFRVYQLELEHGETRAFAFGGIDALQKAGFQQPPAAEYTLVYDGELICPVRQDERDILERIFARYNQAFPPDYRGRSIAPSDVLELYDESERRYFYCDMAGFLQVKFSPALAKKA